MRLGLALLAVLGLSGCAGSGCRITAASVEQPVSLTKVLFDSRGDVVFPGQEQVLGHFSFGWRNWSILWLVPLNSRRRDISDRLRREIESRSGDAIINLTVTATTDAWYKWLAAWVPVIPTYVYIQIEGDVVLAGEYD
ncbi:MAG: hypothetical protein ACYS8L_08350 [Planctomycetota bacterium]|jgi:hypothetical protein